MTAPAFSLVAADDPLGLAGDFIQLENVTSQEIKERHEVIGDLAKYITNAVVEKRPRTEGTSTYRLLDTASLVLPMGVAVNTNFVITGISGSYTQEDNPIVTVNWVQFSAIAKLLPYTTPANAIETLTGGYGVTALFGATLPVSTSPISSDFSIEVLTGDAGLGLDADYIDGGMYYYGFKRVVNASAYGVITIPAGGYETSRDDGTTKAPEGWENYSASWFEYLDATTLV